MTHLWQWQMNPPTSARLYRNGSSARLHRSTGSTSGNYKKEGHCTYTTAYTLLIPLCVTRYYYIGKTNGVASFRKWDAKAPRICGYERMGHITQTGNLFFKHTLKRYTNLWQRTWRDIAPVLKISTKTMLIAPITPLAGGGARERPLIYSKH